jgi:hypothetical protein
LRSEPPALKANRGAVCKRGPMRVVVTRLLLAIGPHLRCLPYRWRLALASQYMRWLMRTATPEEFETFKAQARWHRLSR